MFAKKKAVARKATTKKSAARKGAARARVSVSNDPIVGLIVEKLKKMAVKERAAWREGFQFCEHIRSDEQRAAISRHLKG